MTVKRVRQELDAIRESLATPVTAREPSAFQDIDSRLDRLAARQREAGERPTATQMAGLATWWRERFGQEMTR